MKGIELSIIIPTFNRCMFVHECLDSFLGMIEVEHEVIVIDDGSNDNTVETLTQVKFPINVFSQKNAGACAARNYGLQQARGRFVKFLDDDDWLIPSVVDAQVKYLSARPELDACYSGVALLGDDRRVNLVGRAPGSTFEDLLISRFDGAWLFPPLAYMLRRESALKTQWNTELSSSQDTEYFSRLIIEGFRFGWLPGIVGWIRDDAARERVSQKSPDKVQQMVENQLRVLEGIYIHLAEKGLLVDRLLRALAFRYYKISIGAYENDKDYSKLRKRLKKIFLFKRDIDWESKGFRYVSQVAGYRFALNMRQIKKKFIFRAL